MRDQDLISLMEIARKLKVPESLIKETSYSNLQKDSVKFLITVFDKAMSAVKEKERQTYLAMSQLQYCTAVEQWSEGRRQSQPTK